MTGLVDRVRAAGTEAVTKLSVVPLSWTHVIQIFCRTPPILYEFLRRYSESSELWDRFIAVAPHKWGPPASRAGQAFLERADVRPLRKALSTLLVQHPEPRRTMRGLEISSIVP